MDEIKKNETENEYGYKEFGEEIQKLRMSKGITLEEITDDTKIQLKYLQAIENGEPDTLPKGPYRRSFVRQYCEYLRSEELWNKFDQIDKLHTRPAQYDIKKYKDNKSMIGGKRRVFRSRSYIWVYIIIIICLAGAGALMYYNRTELRSEAVTPNDGGTTKIVARKKSEEQAAQHAEQDTQTVEETKAAEEPAAAEAARAPVLRLSSPGAFVWLKITRGDEKLFEGITKADTLLEYEVTDTPIRVRYGAMQKTKIEWNGAEVPDSEKQNGVATCFYMKDGTVSLTGQPQQ